MQLPSPEFVPTPIPLDAFEFAILFLLVLAVVAMLLPRKWFVKIVDVALPFLPKELR
jgi:hypothetical protein